MNTFSPWVGTEASRLSIVGFPVTRHRVSNALTHWRLFSPAASLGLSPQPQHLPPSLHILLLEGLGATKPYYYEIQAIPIGLLQGFCRVFAGYRRIC